MNRGIAAHCNHAALEVYALVYIPAEESPTGVAYGTFYQVFVGTHSTIGPLFESDPAFKVRAPGGCPDGYLRGLSKLIVERHAVTFVDQTRRSDLRS